MNIADKIFEGGFAENDLENELEILLGEEDYYNQLEIHHWDWYDSSIEMVFKEGWRGLTREEADKILDFGFSIVYETIGDEGIYWTKTVKAKCRPSKAKGSPEKRLLSKYRKILINLGKINE